MGFIDASKAFDQVNPEKLFDKLKRQGVPGYIGFCLTGTLIRRCWLNGEAGFLPPFVLAMVSERVGFCLQFNLIYMLIMIVHTAENL